MMAQDPDSIMSSSRLEQKYEKLRGQLDEHGYHHPLVVDCISLVEVLLHDLVQIKGSLHSTKSQLETLKQYASSNEDLVEPYKNKNAQLLQGNNELHQQVLKLKEERENGSRELKRSFRQLETENTELRFLNSQYLHKILVLEKQSKDKSERILKLQEKNLQAVVQTPGGKKKAISYRRQRMIVDCTLPAQTEIPETAQLAVLNQRKDVYVVDMLKCADTRITQLQQDILNLNKDKEKWVENEDFYKQQLESRDCEIERLTKLLNGGQPREALYKDIWNKSNDRLIDHLNMQIEFLQKENKDLHHRLKESEVSRLEAKNKTADLTLKNEELELELKDVDEMSKSLQENTGLTIERTQSDLIQLKEENLQLQKQVEELQSEISQLRMERASLVSDNSRLSSLLSARENDNQRLEELLEKMQADKKRLSDKVNQLTSNEKELVLELQRVKKKGPKKLSSSPNFLDGFIKKIEEERDYYKEESQTLHRLLRAKHSSPFNRSGDLTSPSKKENRLVSSNVNYSPSKNVHNISPVQTYNHELSKKGKKCLSYDNMLLPDNENVASTHEKAFSHYLHSSSPSLHYRASPIKEGTFIKDASDQTEVTRLIHEKNELKKIIDEYERSAIEMKSSIHHLSTERDQFQKLYEDVRLELQTMRHDLIASPARQSLASQAAIRRLETEQDKKNGELRKISLERDSLRERLKLATDTQLIERSRLEKKLEELQNTILLLEHERTELKMGNESRQGKIVLLEDKTKSQNQRLNELSQEVSHHKMNASQLRLVLEQTEKAVQDLQRHLLGKESELQAAHNKVIKLKQNLEDISVYNKDQRMDMTSLKNTINILDKEKDVLQAAMDDKTERIVKLEEELLTKAREITEAKLRLSEFELRIEKNEDIFGNKDHEIRSLQRQLDNTNQELMRITHSRQAAVLENRRLQEDLMLMTTENQTVHQELDEILVDRNGLKTQVQHYIGEIGRIEALLSVKEAERAEILEQYRSLSLEASRYENQTMLVEGEVSNIRLQLLAKETELRHTKEHCQTLEQEINEHLAAQQSYEMQFTRLTNSLAHFERSWKVAQAEKESALQDLSAVRDICVKLDSSKETIVKQLTAKDIACTQLQKSLEAKQSELDMLRHQMSSERSSIKSLETLLSSHREKEFSTQLSTQEKIAEIQLLREKISNSESRIESQSREIATLRNRASELEIEADRLRRQLTSERFEREKAQQEFRRFSAKSSIVSPPKKQYIAAQSSVIKEDHHARMRTTLVSPESSDPQFESWLPLEPTASDKIHRASIQDGGQSDGSSPSS